MKKKSHIQLASYISGREKLIPHSFLFKLGSVMPDLFLFSYIKGHKYSSTSHKTSEILEKLLSKRKWGRISCFRMGYRIHYLADYFTFPHDPAYSKGLMHHNRYESAMKPSLEQALNSRSGEKTADCRPDELSEKLRRLHDKYCYDAHGIDSDINYILKISDMFRSAVVSAKA